MRCYRCDAPAVRARGQASNGGWQVFWYCPDCRMRAEKGAHNLPHRDVADLASLPVAWSNLGEGWAPCDRCGEKAALQMHHWAPRHLFGDECDEWPTANLCQKCHERWHRLVTPHMSQPQTVREILAGLPLPQKKDSAA